jgi:hypothetical protein
MKIEVLNCYPDGREVIEEIEVADDYFDVVDPEPEDENTAVWDALDAAYQEGVDSV